MGDLPICDAIDPLTGASCARPADGHWLHLGEGQGWRNDSRGRDEAGASSPGVTGGGVLASVPSSGPGATSAPPAVEPCVVAPAEGADLSRHPCEWPACEAEHPGNCGCSATGCGILTGEPCCAGSCPGAANCAWRPDGTRAQPCGQPDHLFGPCILSAGHGYWHRDAEGHEWGATPREVPRG